VMKGLKKIWNPDIYQVMAIAVLGFAISYFFARPLIHRQSEGMPNRNQSLRTLFHMPLIFSAALLSFAHGANDVANAVGPLAAIIHSTQSGDIASKVHIPLWVMLIGAVGISLGLFFYGPRIIRTVGEQITRMNPMRAYCVALAAAITVIVASLFGLPVSSTHITVGAVFGVGFFREYYTTHSSRRRAYVLKRGGAVDAETKVQTTVPEELQRRKLVRRTHFMVIVAAWLVTVPASAILSGLVFFALSAFR